jgi:hypothetical protein
MLECRYTIRLLCKGYSTTRLTGQDISACPALRFYSQILTSPLDPLPNHKDPHMASTCQGRRCLSIFTQALIVSTHVLKFKVRWDRQNNNLYSVKPPLEPASRRAEKQALGRAAALSNRSAAFLRWCIATSVQLSAQEDCQCPATRQNSPTHCTARFSSSVGPPLSRYIQLVLYCILKLLPYSHRCTESTRSSAERISRTPTAAEGVRYHIALSAIPKGTA